MCLRRAQGDGGGGIALLARLPFTTGSSPSEGLDGDWYIELEGENTATPTPPLGRGYDLLQPPEAERTPNLTPRLHYQSV